LKNGLSDLLGKTMPTSIQGIKQGTLLVGTPRSSDIIAKLNFQASLDTLGTDGFIICFTQIDGKEILMLAANEDIGLLYGAFHLLRLIQTQQSLKHVNIVSRPRIQHRLLNHWDNLDGTIERGYAGKSLWKWNELPDKIDNRYKDYARANASLGINGTVLNNVNANPDILKPEYLKKIAKLADVFRPYGIHVFLSINFSSPLSAKFTMIQRRGGIGNLKT
jgi:alpha-glucuronidase